MTRANRLAHVLAGRGVGAGDHVAVYAWNRAEWVEAWWASYKLRAVPININYRYVGEELRYVLGNADAKAVLHEAEFAALLDEVAPDLPQLEVTPRARRAIRDRACFRLSRARLRAPLSGRRLHALHRRHHRHAERRRLAS